MIRTLANIKGVMEIIYCYKAKEICMYDRMDWLCYHWDTEDDSIEIIKEYCKHNNIKLTDIVFEKNSDYLHILERSGFNINMKKQ